MATTQTVPATASSSGTKQAGIELMALTLEESPDESRSLELFRKLRGKYFWVKPIQGKLEFGQLTGFSPRDGCLFVFILYGNGSHVYKRSELLKIQPEQP